MRADMIIHTKDAQQYFGSGNHEMHEMVELVVRGLVENLSDDDIYESCHVLAEPVFGEDYHEYVDELISILRGGMSPQDFKALKTKYELYRWVLDPDLNLSVSVIEPNFLNVSLEGFRAERNGCNSQVLEPIRAHGTIGP